MSGWADVIVISTFYLQCSVRTEYVFRTPRTPSVMIWGDLPLP